MSRSVYANNRNFSHKGSGDKAVCSVPDVCKTPIGSATPPIPYVVSSQASNLGAPTTTVTIDGNPTAIASSTHTQCTGDQAGTAKGLISSTTADKTHFVSYSFDVKAEGEGVVRHMDATTMNNRNTMGMNFGAATSPTSIADEEVEADSIYLLRFVLLDELGQPIKGIPYATAPAGQGSDLDLPSGKTNIYGKTFIASTTQNERIDCHIVWKKFKVKANTSQG